MFLIAHYFMLLNILTFFSVYLGTINELGQRIYKYIMRNYLKDGGNSCNNQKATEDYTTYLNVIKEFSFMPIIKGVASKQYQF
ncbi:MAG TPA: hypothetical protein VEV62_19100 [Parafilimonas sp.]|nr:hypothetical protein [Parafilimonas sp.]